MNILVINGVNLNMLGIREKEIYGGQSYNDLTNLIKSYAKEKSISVKCVQSNFEGTIVGHIQKAYKKFDGIIINAGAYTHTSIAILDALKSVAIDVVEVHISDIAKRESFRQHSYIALVAQKVIVGKGFKGYLEAIDFLINKN